MALHMYCPPCDVTSVENSNVRVVTAPSMSGLPSSIPCWTKGSPDTSKNSTSGGDVRASVVVTVQFKESVWPATVPPEAVISTVAGGSSADKEI